MTETRLGKGISDPVSYECTCQAKDQPDGGKVLLFYRYFGNNPPLPNANLTTPSQIQELASWHRDITTSLHITGKIRVATEGFNITVAGTTPAIETYISSCLTHWSFANLPLSSKRERKAFFKPSPGCACVFKPATEASIRVCAEITPLGITNYAPASWDTVEELSPAEFHRRCCEEQVSLMDLRNHYESRIGYFVDPRTGDAALRPQIRRFSQWPRYVKTNHEDQVTGGEDVNGRQILTYCTGGIRCEKATRWMAEREASSAEKSRISTLKGGIAAYLDWIDEEVAAGRMDAEDSLFKGKNYVFDARGAVGLTSSSSAAAPVSQCHVCGTPEDRLGKCRSPGCHLVLVVCKTCDEDGDPRCCSDCRDQAMSGTRDICSCEKAREFGLWGPDQAKPPKGQGWRKMQKKHQNLHIPLKLID